MEYHNDMDTRSTAETARVLGTSVPRIWRAIKATGVEPIEFGRGARLTDRDVATLRGHLGYAPTVEGFTREDMFVLAAMSKRPLGVRSARVVARIASVSPTTASRSLAKLMAAGLVVRRTVRRVEGRVVDVEIYDLNMPSAEWDAVADRVREVVLPAPKPRPRPKRVPHYLWQHFWNHSSPSRISLPEDENYVAARLLLSRDPEALAWAATHLSADAIRYVTKLRGVDERERSALLSLAEGREHEPVA